MKGRTMRRRSDGWRSMAAFLLRALVLIEKRSPLAVLSRWY
jgi:hypothetical protein